MSAVTSFSEAVRPRAGDVNDARSLSTHFRRKRDRLLRDFILAQRGARRDRFRIIDIGGNAAYWDRVGRAFLTDNDIDVTCVDPAAPGVRLVAPGIVETPGDGRDLPFADNSFDLVHSNSVIEHVGRSADMRRFANEVRRLAPAYYVQTPNYWFPIDPHFYRVPMFQWLPQPVRVMLLQRWRIGLHPPVADIDRALSLAEYAVLLDRRHFRALFPDARIVDERFLLLSKSMIALRGAAPATEPLQPT